MPVDADRPAALPPTRRIELPGRGSTVVLSNLPNSVHLSVPEAGLRTENGVGRPKPVLVLLHGLTATAQHDWGPVFATLSSRFDVVAFDQRGHGEGIRDGRPFRLVDCADDVAAVADVLGVERVVPVGYSMGGLVAQLVWRRHPDRVAGLVFCATGCRFAPPATGVRAQLGRVRGRVRTALSSRRGEGAVGPLDSASTPSHTPGAYQQGWEECRRFDSRPWIGEVDVPTAVLVTEADRVVPAWIQRELADALPGAVTIPLEDAEHGAPFLRPDRFAPRLLEACEHVLR